MRRSRSTKILATLGPATSTPDQVRALFAAGADAFRLNFSHGTPRAARGALPGDPGDRGRDHAADRRGHRPAGPEAARRQLCRTARSSSSAARPSGSTSRPRPAIRARVCLPHPEIFAAIGPGTELLLDDGKIRLARRARRPRSRRDRGAERRPPVRQQGRQRAERDPAAVAARPTRIAATCSSASTSAPTGSR